MGMLMYRRRPPRQDVATCSPSPPNAWDVERTRLESTLAEQRRAHASEIARLEKAIDGLKQKLREAHERLARRGT